MPSRSDVIKEWVVKARLGEGIGRGCDGEGLAGRVYGLEAKAEGLGWGRYIQHCSHARDCTSRG